MSKCHLKCTENVSEVDLVRTNLTLCWQGGKLVPFLSMYKEGTHHSTAALMRPISEQFYDDDEDKGADSSDSPSEDKTREDQLKVSKFSPRPM